MKSQWSFVLLAIGFMAVATPAFAHHSFAAEFDSTKPIVLTGTVTKLEWTNPHAWIYIDVKDPKSGKVTNWGFELGSPNNLMHSGWTRTTLAVGDVITMGGFLAKDGTAKANTVDIQTAEGKRLLGGSSSGASSVLDNYKK